MDGKRTTDVGSGSGVSPARCKWLCLIAQAVGCGANAQLAQSLPLPQQRLRTTNRLKRGDGQNLRNRTDDAPTSPRQVRRQVQLPQRRVKINLPREKSAIHFRLISEIANQKISRRRRDAESLRDPVFQIQIRETPGSESGPQGRCKSIAVLRPILRIPKLVNLPVVPAAVVAHYRRPKRN